MRHHLVASILGSKPQYTVISLHSTDLHIHSPRSGWPVRLLCHLAMGGGGQVVRAATRVPLSSLPFRSFALSLSNPPSHNPQQPPQTHPQFSLSAISNPQFLLVHAPPPLNSVFPISLHSFAHPLSSRTLSSRRPADSPIICSPPHRALKKKSHPSREPLNPTSPSPSLGSLQCPPSSLFVLQLSPSLSAGLQHPSLEL